MRRLAVLVGITSVLVSCASSKAAGDGSSGIQGTVTIGPTCPVERLDSPCPPAPYAAKLTVSRQGGVVATVTTGNDGAFRIALSPGTYTIRAEPANGDHMARMQPLQPVTVGLGAYTAVSITFDSGIR